MRLPIFAVPLLLAVSACAGGASPDQLTAEECNQLSGIAYAAGPSGFEEDVGLFAVGTSVEDLGDAQYLQEHASDYRAALDSFAERVPDRIKADVQALEELYADWSSAVEKYSGELVQGGGAVESIRDWPSPRQYELADSAARVHAWARTNCVGSARLGVRAGSVELGPTDARDATPHRRNHSARSRDA